MLYESPNASKIRIKKIFAVVSLIVASSLLASCRLRQNSLSRPTPIQDTQTSSPTSPTISPRSSSTQTAFPNGNSGRRQDNNGRQENNRQDNRGNNTQQNRNRRNNRSHPCRF